MAELQYERSLYIDGRWVPGGGADLAVEDPATENTIGVVTQGDTADVDAAVDAARRAFPAWAATPVTERVAALRRLRSVIADRAELFAETVQREQGSPPAVARALHVDTPLAVMDATIDALETFPFATEIGNSLVLREPVGVVAAITPWNLPLHQLVVKIVPALAAGATAVLKPAALTPLTAFELARAIDAAELPAGTVNVVVGDGRTLGDYLARNSGVDHVSFTGSTPVGKQVAAAAATTLAKVTLELGGKSASVILEDIDDARLAVAVKVTVGNCFLNGGQTCTALSRLVVPAARLAQVEDLAAAAAAKYVPGSRLGPVISAAQRKEVESFLEAEACGSRARIVYGGPGSGIPVPERGHYVAPAVISSVDPDSRLAQDEVFGPVLAVLAADSDDHAVEIANNSAYGLSGAVWGSDQDNALQAAARIRTGQVEVNGGRYNPAAPFGGYKQSGIGREIGTFGISDVLEVKAVQR